MLPPSPSPWGRDPNPTMTIPAPATARPVPARGATAGWRWMPLVRWRRHWRPAWGWWRRPWGHSLSMSDNGKSHNCKCRQDSSSVYHGHHLRAPVSTKSTRRPPHCEHLSRLTQSITGRCAPSAILQVGRGELTIAMTLTGSAGVSANKAKRATAAACYVAIAWP